jgi:anti-sigma factor RsiW
VREIGEGEMTGDRMPVREDDLHAYVDGQIEPTRRQDVEQYLRENREAALTVAAYQEQRALLRAAFAPVGTAPLPPRLRLEGIIAARLGRRQTVWRLAAMVVLGIGLGGVAGWYLHGPREPGRNAQAMAVLKQQALASYFVYAGDRRHPIEVTAAEEGHLRQWLSNRLDKAVAPPDLSPFGYKLLGGRLLATEHGHPAALFMYESPNGDRLALVMRPMAADLRAGGVDFSQGKIKGCGWIDNGLGYAVVADAPETELDRIADHLRKGPGGLPSRQG